MSIVGLARNGAEAVRIAKATQPEVVTMDPTMPEMDGIECIQALIQLFPRINILVVSALSDKSTAIAALRLGRAVVAAVQRRRTAPGAARRGRRPLKDRAMDTLNENELKMFCGPGPPLLQDHHGPGAADHVGFPRHRRRGGLRVQWHRVLHRQLQRPVIVSMPPRSLRELLLLQHETDMSDGNLLDAVGDRQHPGRQRPQDAGAGAEHFGAGEAAGRHGSLARAPPPYVITLRWNHQPAGSVDMEKK